MKIKANGITFNYEVTGTDSAPWLIFSNSLATNRDLLSASSCGADMNARSNRQQIRLSLRQRLQHPPFVFGQELSDYVRGIGVRDDGAQNATLFHFDCPAAEPTASFAGLRSMKPEDARSDGLSSSCIGST